MQHIINIIQPTKQKSNVDIILTIYVLYNISRRPVSLVSHESEFLFFQYTLLYSTLLFCFCFVYITIIIVVFTPVNLKGKLKHTKKNLLDLQTQKTEFCSYFESIVLKTYQLVKEIVNIIRV